MSPKSAFLLPIRFRVLFVLKIPQKSPFCLQFQEYVSHSLPPSPFLQNPSFSYFYLLLSFFHIFFPFLSFNPFSNNSSFCLTQAFFLILLLLDCFVLVLLSFKFLCQTLPVSNSSCVHLVLAVLFSFFLI